MKPSINYRHELKFLVNPHQSYIIRHRLRRLMERDGHAADNGEYHIRSLYFDDINNTALHEKLGGVRDRVKYRIRIYNKSDSVIHLEKKIKFRDYIAKVKAPLDRETYEAVLNGRHDALEKGSRPLLLEVRDLMRHKLLRPKVIVDYDREPYICRHGNVRITFDKELRTGLNDLDIFSDSLQPIAAISDNLTILEVKYDSYIPSSILTALQLEGLCRQSASKYVICRKHTKTNSWEDY